MSNTIATQGISYIIHLTFSSFYVSVDLSGLENSKKKKKRIKEFSPESGATNQQYCKKHEADHFGLFFCFFLNNYYSFFFQGLNQRIVVYFEPQNKSSLTSLNSRLLDDTESDSSKLGTDVSRR